MCYPFFQCPSRRSSKSNHVGSTSNERSRSAARLPRVPANRASSGSGRNQLSPSPGKPPVVAFKIQAISCMNLSARDRGGTRSVSCLSALDQHATCTANRKFWSVSSSYRCSTRTRKHPSRKAECQSHIQRRRRHVRFPGPPLSFVDQLGVLLTFFSTCLFLAPASDIKD